MLSIQVCYSRKEGAEFASCTLGGVELADTLLDDPANLRIAVQTAYAHCREAVDTQLIGTSAPSDAPAVPPAIAARLNPPAPATASPPPAVGPPASGSNHYYGNGRGKDGPPKTGAQLGGWAKKSGVIQWFESFARAQNPPLPKLCSEWSAEWAQYAYGQYMATQQILYTPVPSTNGNGHAPY